MADIPNWQLQQFIHRKYQIFLFELNPFSLNHYLCLKAIKSPLLNRVGTISKADLEMACLICSTEFGDNVIEEFKKHNESKEIEEYRKRIDKAILKNENYLKDCCELFFQYIDEYSEAPPTKESLYGDDLTESKDTNGMPWTLMYPLRLMKEFHFSEKEVYDMPIGRMIAYMYAYIFLETGKSPVISELDIFIHKAATGQISTEEFLTGKIEKPQLSD